MQPPVPTLDYTRTCERPGWQVLPPPVQDAVSRACGAPVAAAEPPVTSGFTGGFAAVVHLADGRRAFAKAGSGRNPHLPVAYAQEARVLAVLGDLPDVPAPRLVGAVALDPGEADEHAWQVVVSEVVPGRIPQPWTSAGLAAVHDACVRAAAALTPAPVGLDVPRLAQGFAVRPQTLGALRELATGARPVPAGQPTWLAGRWADLRALVEVAPSLVDGDTANHHDLRADNVLVGPAGATFVDWNWLLLGASWTDLVGVLPLARADGVGVDDLVASSPLTADVDPEAIDAWLAVVAAYMLASADEPVWPGGPVAVRVHQKRYARTYLDWLGERRGWA